MCRISPTSGLGEIAAREELGGSCEAASHIDEFRDAASAQRSHTDDIKGLACRLPGFFRGDLDQSGLSGNEPSARP